MADNRFCRDASDRLSFEMFRVPASNYAAVCAAVAAAFPLSPDVRSFDAVEDAVSMDFRCGQQVVELAWDNWSGFIVTAKTADSESLVREIADWLLRSTWGEQSKAEPVAAPSPHHNIGWGLAQLLIAIAQAMASRRSEPDGAPDRGDNDVVA